MTGHTLTVSDGTTQAASYLCNYAIINRKDPKWQRICQKQLNKLLSCHATVTSVPADIMLKINAGIAPRGDDAP